MGLTISTPPGFADVSAGVFDANDPAFAVNMAKVYSNAVFGLVRCEFFHDIYKNGDTVPLPSSPIDGYVYSREELIYIYHVHSSGDPNGNWISGADSLWYCNWFVNQSTGEVQSNEWYRRSGKHFDGTHTNDGSLRVLTVAQRGKTTLLMGSAPSFTAISSPIAQDKPFITTLAKNLNSDTKFGVVNREVIYCGEFSDADTVPHQSSPVDGYSYGYSEMQLGFSWRWTHGKATFQAPPLSRGQLGPFLASINASTGAVSTTVKYIDDDGNLNSFSDGRIAVFAFCTRSGTPSSITPEASNFQELSYDLFMPGKSLRASTLDVIINDNLQALLTPEFFGPTDYASGDTIPTPTSSVDGYAYSRTELEYCLVWSNTSNNVGSNLRLPMFYGFINPNTGFVNLHTYRLPPGGPYVDDDDSECRITAIVIARRAAELDTTAPSVTVTTGEGQTTSADESGADVPTLSSAEAEAVGGSINGSNQSFTISKAATILFLVWNGQVRFDFSQTGTATSFTTSFTPDTGDTLYAVVTT